MPLLPSQRVMNTRTSATTCSARPQRPKLRPYIEQMEANIASAVGVDVSRVNVKATTEEKLGFTGTEQGMACHAVCLLEE